MRSHQRLGYMCASYDLTAVDATGGAGEVDSGFEYFSVIVG